MTTEAVKRVCPQCGRVLEVDFVSCPYCGRLLGAPARASLPERKKRSKLRWAAGIVLAIILVFAGLSVLGYWLNSQQIRIELVSQDATYVDDGLEITVTLRNLSLRSANLTVKFETSWEHVMSDTKTKEVIIPALQSRTVSATLNAHPSEGLTNYEVNWFVKT